jgi:dolichol kinase
MTSETRLLAGEAWRSQTRLHSGEAWRKVYHISAGLSALGLPFLGWPTMAALMLGACLMNWKLLPRLGGRSLWRGAERARGYSLGLTLYPLAIAVLCLVFQAELWRIAAVWGVLAFGDGMSSLVGMTVGGPRLPWNLRKSWSGLAAFVLFGTLGAALLVSWVELISFRAWASPPVLGTVLLLALVCAVVESLPIKVDDNLSIPAVGALVVAFLSRPLI